MKEVSKTVKVRKADGVYLQTVYTDGSISERKAETQAEKVIQESEQLDSLTEG